MTITLTIDNNSDHCTSSASTFQMKLDDNTFMCLMRLHGLPEIKESKIYANKLYNQTMPQFQEFMDCLTYFKVDHSSQRLARVKLYDIVECAMKREEKIVWDWELG